MSTIDVKNIAGEKVAELELSEAVYGIAPNVPVMHQCVRYLMAADRAGTHDTKGRSEVSGGGRKPWRQKGTGRARQGSIRAPQWRGGGTVWGPHPRSYAFKVNSKEIKLAMRSALSAKLADGQLTVVDDFGFEKPSTKAAVAAMKALGLEGRTTIIVASDDVETFLSFRNVPAVIVVPATEINTYEILDNKNLVITTQALKRIEEVLA